MNNNTTAMNLIDDICKEKEIEETFLSFGWIRELKKNGKIIHIVRNSFDLNPAACMSIVNDKYATYEVLKVNDVPSLEYNVIFNKKTREEFPNDIENKVHEYFEKYNRKIVIKQNSSSEGKGVFLFENEEEAVKKIKELFSEEKEDNINICPFEEIDCEYRAVFLDNEILFVYKKIKSETSWKHNLANGAKPVPLDETDDAEKIKKIALDAGQAVNARFVTVDISKTIDGRIFVMEINGSVCMSKFAEQFVDGKKIAKSIYEKAIDACFFSENNV